MPVGAAVFSGADDKKKYAAVPSANALAMTTPPTNFPRGLLCAEVRKGRSRAHSEGTLFWLPLNGEKPSSGIDPSVGASGGAKELAECSLLPGRSRCTVVDIASSQFRMKGVFCAD